MTVKEGAVVRDGEKRGEKCRYLDVVERGRISWKETMRGVLKIAVGKIEGIGPIPIYLHCLKKNLTKTVGNRI